MKSSGSPVSANARGVLKDSRARHEHTAQLNCRACQCAFLIRNGGVTVPQRQPTLHFTIRQRGGDNLFGSFVGISAPTVNRSLRRSSIE